MPAATVGLLLAGFWSDNSNWVTAVVSIVLAVAFATLLDRAFSRRSRLTEAVTRNGLNPKLDTRLRFVRRLLYATIVMVGVFIALSQFTGLSRLAASVLASGAIAAAIIGFAARQTLANVVAGIMLAITQPLRVGDWVAFEDEYGVVEDVRLNFTVLRTSADVRVIIPNERLAAGILRNDTLISDRVDLEVELWLAPDADVEQAISVLEEEAGSRVRAAEVTSDGIRLAVSGEPAQPSERIPQEAELRRRCLKRLRAEGLLASG